MRKLSLMTVILKTIKTLGQIFVVLVILWVLLVKTGSNARVGMFMLLAIPFAIYGLLVHLKAKLNKTPTQEGYEAFVNKIPKSNNPYLKPYTETENMEAAELWFVGYLDAEKENPEVIANAKNSPGKGVA